MSENLSRVDIKEILKPQNTPEMAFESFFMLVGDREKRENTKEDFLSGRIINPKLDYPRLNEQTLDEGIKSLLHILTVAESFDGDEKSAIWDSAAYRMADMYLLKSLLNLQTQVQGGNEQKINQAAESHQRLNEELFGKPSEELTEQVFGEAFAQIKAKKLSQGNMELLEDLINGFSMDIADEQIDVPTVYLETEAKLPVISEAEKNKLADYVKLNNADIFEIVDNYFNNYVANREEDQQEFSPVDVFTIFKIVNTVRDPENAENIGVVLDDDSTTLSWDTSKMSIVVGNRRVPIKTKEQVTAVVMHEYGVHATRAVNGLKSNLPTLGTGLFTEADDGENVDY